MSQNRFPDLRTQKRGPTAGAQASKERSLPNCWLYVLRKQDVAISPCANRSSELESGPTAEVTLQEQPSQIDQLCPTVSLPLVPAYWQNLKKGQLAKEPLKCDLQRPNLCITGESLERKQIKAERLQINNQQVSYTVDPGTTHAVGSKLWSLDICLVFSLQIRLALSSQ